MTNNGGVSSKSVVAVVGGGTAGLALATELKRLGVGSVIVLEREKNAGAFRAIVDITRLAFASIGGF